MVGEALTNAAPVELLDETAAVLAARLEEELLLLRVVAPVVVAVVVGAVVVVVTFWIWFLTVWLKVPVMRLSVNIEEKER